MCGLSCIVGGMEFGTGQDGAGEDATGDSGHSVYSRLVPTTEAAHALGVSAKHLRYLARKGLVPCRRLGIQWMFFEAWLIWMTTWTLPAPGEPFWAPPVSTPEEVLA